MMMISFWMEGQSSSNTRGLWSMNRVLGITLSLRHSDLLSIKSSQEKVKTIAVSAIVTVTKAQCYQTLCSQLSSHYVLSCIKSCRWTSLYSTVARTLATTSRNEMARKAKNPTKTTKNDLNREIGRESFKQAVEKSEKSPTKRGGWIAAIRGCSKGFRSCTWHTHTAKTPGYEPHPSEWAYCRRTIKTLSGYENSFYVWQKLNFITSKRSQVLLV